MSASEMLQRDWQASVPSFQTARRHSAHQLASVYKQTSIALKRMNPERYPLKIDVTRDYFDYDSEGSPSTASTAASASASASSVAASSARLSACESLDRALLLRALEHNFEEFSDELLEHLGAHAPLTSPAAGTLWLAECALWLLSPIVTFGADMHENATRRFCERGLLADCGSPAMSSSSAAPDVAPAPLWWALCLTLFPLSTAIGNLLVIASIARSATLRNTLTSWCVSVQYSTGTSFVAPALDSLTLRSCACVQVHHIARCRWPHGGRHRHAALHLLGGTRPLSHSCLECSASSNAPYAHDGRVWGFCSLMRRVSKLTHHNSHSLFRTKSRENCPLLDLSTFFTLSLMMLED